MIRKATYHDAPFIKLLMEDLGNKTTVSLLITQLNALFNQKDHEVWVYEDKGMVTGFAIFHVLPKLGSENALLLITGLVASEQAGKNALERYLVDLSRKGNYEHIRI